jgi:phosphopantothenate synthetase
MKTSEKNLITEINRIHQLMGVKKLITEQRKLIVPLLGMAQEFLEYVSKRTIDDVATRRAVSELQTAVNAVRASGGRVNPLTSEEYIKIFNNLRRSVDPNIAAKMVEFDRKIVTLIRSNGHYRSKGIDKTNNR